MFTARYGLGRVNTFQIKRGKKICSFMKGISVGFQWLEKPLVKFVGLRYLLHCGE